MTISAYQKGSEPLFKVRIQLRSRKYPSLRVSEQASGIKSIAEAERMNMKLERDLQRKLVEMEVRRATTGQTWGAVLDHWYDSQCRIRVPFGSISQVSLDDYYHGMKKVMAVFDRTSCSDIKPLDLMLVFNGMADRGVSLGHRKKMRTKIKSVFEHGAQSGLICINRNPVHELTLKKTEEKKPEILTIGEIRKLIERAYSQKHEWRHVWALALLTGMRNGELIALRWSDVDWDQNLITVSQAFSGRKKEISSTKSGEWRDIPMSQDCLRILAELRQETGNTEFILPRLNRWENGEQAAILRVFCLEQGLPSVRFHALRACFGTQLLRQGVPAAIVMKIAGWKDLKTMQRYIRLAGVEVQGATDCLSVLPASNSLENVISLHSRS